MKKVILMLFATLMFLGHAKANVDRNIPKDGIVVTMIIEIGLPIICTPAWSICKLTIGTSHLAVTSEILAAADDRGAGQGGGGGGGYSWLINIPRDNFVKYYPTYLSKLDGKNSVTFDYSYSASDDIKKALGTSADLIVQQGVPYPLKYENGIFTITLPVK